MDNAVLNDGDLSQYPRFVSSDGSRAVAQAPVLPSDEGVPVKQGPGPEVWEIHRPTIKRLYLDEDKTLKDVMAIMQRDYGHKATEKMYKSRFDKWGLQKNCKSNEMKAIARKKVERDAIGKASLFRVRGRPVEIEEVLRYFKRKSHLSLQELVVREMSPRSATPSDIEVTTPGAASPPPSSNDAHFVDCAPVTVAETGSAPSPRESRNYGHMQNPPHPTSDLFRRNSLWMNNNLRRLSSLSRISPSLEPPRDLLIPERLFSTIKTFLKSTWDRNLWISDEQGDLVSRKKAHWLRITRGAVYDFEECCVSAIGLLEHGLFVEARQQLCKACEKCIDVVREEHPETMSCILYIYLDFAGMGYGAAAIKVLEHLRSMARVTLSTPHVFHQFIENFLMLNHDMEEVYFAAWRCSDDIFQQYLEPFHESWLISRLKHIDEISWRGSRPEAESLLRSLLKKCEQVYGRSSSRCQKILYNLASNLYYQKKHEEAERIGQAILQSANHSKSKGADDNWMMMRALYTISEAQYCQCKDEQAEYSLRQCMDIAVKFYGEQNPLTLRYSLRLEKWLRFWGREEEASAIAAQRSRILGPPEIEELME